MSALEHPGLVFRSLDPDDSDAEHLKGWFQAVRRGFHQGRGNDEALEKWLDHVRADSLTVRGAWVEDARVGSGAIPVATFSSWAGSVNVGGSVLPVDMISDVTVSPTHRRQGLLRKLMTVDLADAAAAGLPLAALTASEGTIYGRFGFGLATFAREIEVDVTSRFGLRPEIAHDDGSLVLTEPGEAWKAVSEVYEQAFAQTRGAVSRPQFYQPWLTSEFDFDSDSKGESRQRAAIHLDADGTPDGYVVYKVESDRNDAGYRVAKVVDLAAVTPASYLRLWRLLADIDLVDRVTWHKGPIEEPLLWAVTDPYGVRTTCVDDFLWIRVLDVVPALQARPWYADGAVVLEIDDPLGHAAGRWALVVTGGSAEVSRTDAEPGVRLAADTLGSLYLGGVDVTTLASAGRITGSPQALAIFAALADGGPAPHCITGF